MKKIYIKDWLAYKPYAKEGTADIYYMNLANKIIHVLSDIKQEHNLLFAQQEEELVDLAVFLTTYFEDVISNVGIFKAFKSISKEFYGKNLPFFEGENFADEINVDDLQFLLWYFFNLPKQDFLFNPKHESFKAIAKAVYAVLDDAFEYAPENLMLKQYFSIKDVENYDEVRYFFDKLLIKSFMFKYDTGVDLHFKSIELTQDRSQAGFQRYKSFRDYYVINQHTKLFGLRSSDWTAALFSENEVFSKALKNTSENQQNVFRFIELEGNNLKVEHLISGKEVVLAGDNFLEAKKLPKDALFSAGVNRWRDQYVITGILWANQYDEKVVENYKKQTATHHIFESDEELRQRKEETEWEFNLFQQKASHSFFHIADVQEGINFVNAFYQEVEAHHEIDKEQITSLLQQIDVQKKVRCLLFFYNEKSGLEIYLNFPESLPIENNPFFQKEEKDLLMKMLMSEEFSGEIYRAFKYHFHFESEINAYNENDQNFLLRFFKPNQHQY